MTLKQFLKPDWRKIVIFVALTIILFSIIYSIINAQREWLQARMGIDVFSECCINRGKLEGCASDEIIQRYKTCEGFEKYRQNQEFLNNISMLLPIAIISYLLSCFIIWIYDKFRKRK